MFKNQSKIQELFLWKIPNKILSKIYKDSFRHLLETLFIKCSNNIYLLYILCICFKDLVFYHFFDQLKFSLFEPAKILLIILHQIIVLFFKHQNSSRFIISHCSFDP